MPLYEYACVDCKAQDQRVAGLDDHTALCLSCGGIMLRLDEDLFTPYFLSPDCPWCIGPTPAGQPPKSHKICDRHALELREG
jgi:hypothetical protein